MSAAEALKAARAAGVRVNVYGDKLKLSADAKPPAVVIDLLRLHKGGVMALLREEAGSRENEKAGPAHLTASGPKLNYCHCGQVGISDWDGRSESPNALGGIAPPAFPERGPHDKERWPPTTCAKDDNGAEAH